MNKRDLERLVAIEKRVAEIAKAHGLLTTEIDFEVVPAQRMLEGMAYMFPTNFSHWSFGRDYEKHRTIYEHTGHGIPYEQVWNFDRPKALLVETNPLALNALIVAHVYGHVDYFLGSGWLTKSHSVADIAEQARNAAVRFREYEVKYGKDEVEKTIDSGMSIWWQQHPDITIDEELDSNLVRERMLAEERRKLEHLKRHGEFSDKKTAVDIKEIEARLEEINISNPPAPVYDLLGYVTRYSQRLRPWQQDILSVLRNQARTLAPNMRTKMLNEGWASYWHVLITRQLFAEGLLTQEEHGIYNTFHSQVTQKSRFQFNWYSIGLAIFNYTKERWDKGRYGREFDECADPVKKAYWDTAAGKGSEKLFEIRSHYTDRMAVEELFTDEFIHEMELYIYEERMDYNSGVTDIVIAEKNPAVIRRLLKQSLSLYGMQPVSVRDSNYLDRGELLLIHDHKGVDLDMKYTEGTLVSLFYLWGKKIWLETILEGKQLLISYGKKGLEIKR